MSRAQDFMELGELTEKINAAKKEFGEIKEILYNLMEREGELYDALSIVDDEGVKLAPFIGVLGEDHRKGPPAQELTKEKLVHDKYQGLTEEEYNNEVDGPEKEPSMCKPIGIHGPTCDDCAQEVVRALNDWAMALARGGLGQEAATLHQAAAIIKNRK